MHHAIHVQGGVGVGSRELIGDIGGGVGEREEGGVGVGAPSAQGFLELNILCQLLSASLASATSAWGFLDLNVLGQILSALLACSAVSALASHSMVIVQGMTALVRTGVVHG